MLKIEPVSKGHIIRSNIMKANQHDWTQEQIKDFISKKLESITTDDNIHVINFLRNIIFSNLEIDYNSVRKLIIQFSNQKTIDVVLPREVPTLNSKQIQFECYKKISKR